MCQTFLGTIIVGFHHYWHLPNSCPKTRHLKKRKRESTTISFMGQEHCMLAWGLLWEWQNHSFTQRQATFLPSCKRTLWKNQNLFWNDRGRCSLRHEVCISGGNGKWQFPFSVSANCWRRITLPDYSSSVSIIYMDSQQSGHIGRPGMLVHSGPGIAKWAQLW